MANVKSAVFETNFDDYKQFMEFQEDFKVNIIENGLDKPINKSLEQLRTTLKDKINERVSDPATQGLPPSKLPEKNGLDQKFVNLPKSESDILEYLTDSKTDLSKYNKAKDFTSLDESKIVFGNYDRGMNKADRITLRMEIDPGETVEQQYIKAKAFFVDAIIAIPDYSGQTNYFMNPGLDLSDYVKIKCSTMTGDGNTKPKKGVSPQERFNRDSDDKSYAQWTLKKEAVDIIRKEYINLTPVINSIKDGKFSKALIELRSLSKKGDTKQLLDLQDKVNELKKESPKVSKQMRNYTKVIRTIDSLDIIKEIKFNTTYYSLDVEFQTEVVKPEDSSDGNNETHYEDSVDEKQEYLSVSRKIETTIRKWVGINENVWFEDLIKQVDNLIRLYTSTYSSTMKVR
jgi:hypothetical protein